VPNDSTTSPEESMSFIQNGRDAKWFAKVTWAGVVAGLSIFVAALAMGPNVFVTNVRFEDHLKTQNDESKALADRLARMEKDAQYSTQKLDRMESRFEIIETKLDAIKDRLGH
jgi:hypothetical protein